MLIKHPYASTFNPLGLPEDTEHKKVEYRAPFFGGGVEDVEILCLLPNAHRNCVLQTSPLQNR